MQVLHYQHQRSLSGDSPHRVGYGGKQPGQGERIRLPGGMLWQQPACRWRVQPAQRVEDAEQSRVRGSGGKRNAPTSKYPHPVQVGSELLHQAGLADPRVTFNQHQPTMAKPYIGQCGAKCCYLR